MVVRLRSSAAAAVVVAVVTVTSLLLTRGRPELTPPSAAEIARAEAEGKWTLAYLGEIGRRTGLAVRDDVIHTRVLKPAGDAVKSALGAASGAVPENNGGST